MISVRIRGSNEQSVIVEKSYWTGEASAENARQGVLRLKRMGLCTGEIYKVVQSAIGDFYVGVL